MSNEPEQTNEPSSVEPVATTPETSPPEPKSLIDAPPQVEPEAPAALTFDQLSIPEELEMDELLRDEFLGVFNNAELDSAGRANALLALHAKVAQAASEASSKQWDDLQAEWQNEVKSDPEIGGKNFDTSLRKIGGLITEFGDDDLRQAFNMTGAGNNPHVIRFLAKLADQLGEGRRVSGEPPAAARDLASTMYPTMRSNS